MPDEIPSEQRAIYYKAYYEPTSGEYYSLRNPDTGLWFGETVPAVFIDGLPNIGAGKGGRTVKSPKRLRSKR
jgi:hypothetical protein